MKKQGGAWQEYRSPAELLRSLGSRANVRNAQGAYKRLIDALGTINDVPSEVVFLAGYVSAIDDIEKGR